MVMIRSERQKKKEQANIVKNTKQPTNNRNTQTVKKRLNSMSLYTTKYKPVDTQEKRLTNQEVYEVSKQLIKFGLEKGYY